MLHSTGVRVLSHGWPRPPRPHLPRSTTRPPAFIIAAAQLRLQTDTVPPCPERRSCQCSSASVRSVLNACPTAIVEIVIRPTSQRECKWGSGGARLPAYYIHTPSQTRRPLREIYRTLTKPRSMRAHSAAPTCVNELFSANGGNLGWEARHRPAPAGIG